LAPSAAVTIDQTERYSRWFARLRDERAKSRILIRVRRLSLGNLGDSRPVGGGISELRIDYGPGYRIYFARRGAALILQWADIAKARESAAQWERE
jgi:putative addiction module killer protein